MKYNLNTQRDSNPGCNLLGIMIVAGLYTLDNLGVDYLSRAATGLGLSLKTLV